MAKKPINDDTPKQEKPASKTWWGRLAAGCAAIVAATIAFFSMKPENDQKPADKPEPTPITRKSDPKTPPIITPKVEETPLSAEEVRKKNIEAFKDAEFSLTWSYVPDANEKNAKTGLTGQFKIKSFNSKDGEYFGEVEYVRTNSAGGREKGDGKIKITEQGKLTIEMKPEKETEFTIKGSGQVTTDRIGKFGMNNKNVAINLEYRIEKLRSGGRMSLSPTSDKKWPVIPETNLNFSTKSYEAKPEPSKER